MPTQEAPYLFNVIGEKHRLQILCLLSSGAANVEEIRRDLNMEATLLSKHLKVLRLAGLIKSQREGRRLIYSIEKKLVRRVRGKPFLNLSCCQIQMK